MVRIEDIAAELNVSRSLVGKVLNGRMGTTLVRPELAEKIRLKAVELGYHKNMSAVALLNGRHQVLGVYIHRMGTAGSGLAEDLLDGITTAASSHHQRLLLDFFTTDSACRALLKNANRGIMDGLLICGIPHPGLAAELRTLQQTGLPVMTVYSDPLDPLLPNVGIDSELVARLATEHLITQGCRLICHIRNEEERFCGYQAALRAHGLPARSEQIFDGEMDYTHKIGEQAVAEFSRRGVQLDGIVASSDQAAAGCLNALTRAGRRVPEDVRVIGIDNAPFLPLCRGATQLGVAKQPPERPARRGTSLTGDRRTQSKIDPCATGADGAGVDFVAEGSVRDRLMSVAAGDDRGAISKEADRGHRPLIQIEGDSAHGDVNRKGTQRSQRR